MNTMKPAHLQCKNLGKRSLKTWNLMIQTSTNNGFFSESLHLYSSMLKSNLHGDHFTFPFVAKSCGKLRAFLDAMKVHAHAILLGFQSDVFVQTSFSDMYSKCSNLDSSIKVFEEMTVRSLVSWNAMIHAYSSELEMRWCFDLLREMRVGGFKPNASTFVSIVSGCSAGNVLVLKYGSAIHCYGIKVGLDLDVMLGNAILSMYVRFELVDDACLFFDLMKSRSTVSWTAMMGGYVKIGDFARVFDLFRQMLTAEIELDFVVYVNLVACCVSSGSMFAGCLVHSLLIKSGFDCERTIAASLINLYARQNSLSSATRIFDSIQDKDAYLWTTMISGYVQRGKLCEALVLIDKLLRTTIEPNEVTVITILSACANVGSLAFGEKIEQYIRKYRFDSDVRVLTSLIHMYSKCGSIERAKEIFDETTTKDMALWSAMINGYACHGKGKEALALFKTMQSDGSIEPDTVVFTDILSACRHSGLVEEGLKYFDSMQKDYNIEPSVEHYLCIVDLLVRAGDIQSAFEIVNHAPLQARDRALACLLNACRDHQDVGIRELVSNQLFDSKLMSTENYVVMANVCASLGRWEEASRFRRLIDKRGSFKEAGWSRIESIR